LGSPVIYRKKLSVGEENAKTCKQRKKSLLTKISNIFLMNCKAERSVGMTSEGPGTKFIEKSSEIQWGGGVGTETKSKKNETSPT